MSEQQSPLTYEGVLEMFRETRLMIQEIGRKQEETSLQIKETSEQMKDTDRKMKETDRKMKETNRQIAALGSRIGQIVENMIGGNIVAQFQEFGYEINDYCRNRVFESKELDISGEIDLLLENGDIAILIEVKTTLETEDIRDHIERLEKFRHHIDAKGNDQRRFLGAVAGAVVTKDIAKFAQKHGMYVIVQSGEAVEIMTPPEDFVAKKW